MKSTFKKIILFILIIGAIIIVAILVFGKEKIQTNVLQSQNQSLLSTTEPSTANDSAKFLQSLAQVKSMKLDTTFFANKSYWV